MNFFLTAVMCRIKLAATRSLIASMLLYIVFLAFVAFAFGDRQVFVMNVGLFCPGTEYSVGLAADFERYAAENVFVARYSELEPMLKDVANGRLECAYELPEEYTPEKSMALYVTQDTRGAAISNVLLASAYMKDMAAEFGYKVLRFHIPNERNEITEELTARNLDYLSQGAFMEIDYLARKSGREQESGSSLRYAQNGVTALFAWLITMLLCLRLVQEKKTSVESRLALAGNSTAYAIANIAAIFLINIFFFTVAALIIGAPSPQAVIAYALFISAFGVCLGNAIRSESIYLGLTVSGFLCTAVLGGVLIDIGGLLPALDWSKYLFPTYYYMEILRGGFI